MHKQSCRFWPILIVGFLTANAVGVGILIFAASSDPSHQVEPNYYAKALAWNAYMAQVRKNHRLGWSQEVSLLRTDSKGAIVHSRLRDRSGAPLSGASIQLQAFHKARAGQVWRLVLKEQAPGSYQAPIPAARSGIWELRFVIDRDGQHFTQRLDRELSASSRRPSGVALR